MKIYAEVPTPTVFYMKRVSHIQTREAALARACAHAEIDRASIAGELVWSGLDDVPALGAFVEVKLNSIGRAVVCGFFALDGYLGLYVRPINPPAWLTAQNGDKPCHVFGAELMTQVELQTKALTTPAVTRRRKAKVA